MGFAMVPPSPRPLRLKDDCGMQLENAFASDQWATVINLARQRYKSTKDKYYLAIEIAAKTQGDDPVDVNAGKTAVEKMIEENAPAEDTATLDVIEFACADAFTSGSLDYSKTMGMLRAKAVKASPKDIASGNRCFNACVWNMDWKNAQQIATTLNVQHKDRKFFFRYILSTYILSTSGGTPQEQRLFSSLAKRFADKAIECLNPDVGAQSPHQVIVDEEELWLCLDIRFQHATVEENLKLLRKEHCNALSFLQRGFELPYRTVVMYLSQHGAWDELAHIGSTILDRALDVFEKEDAMIDAEKRSIDKEKKATAKEKVAADDKEKTGQDPSSNESSDESSFKTATTRVRDKRKDTDNHYVAACHDWFVWKSQVRAATEKKGDDGNKKALKQVGKLMDRTIRALERAGDVKPVFRKNRDLLSLEILFARCSEATPGTVANPTTRPNRLYTFVSKHYDDKSCFEDIYPFVAQLSKEELDVLISQLGQTANDGGVDKHKSVMFVLMISKIRSWMATSKKFKSYVLDDKGVCVVTCLNCLTKVKGIDCHLDSAECMTCLKAIAENVLDVFRSATVDGHLRVRIKLEGKQDCISELAVVGSTCLLRFARIGHGDWDDYCKSPFIGIYMGTHAQLFLQAVAWLEFYVMSSAKTDPLRLLLVKLYLVMGCASRAKKLWDSFDVKNAILDSLGPLFFDRLSTISPKQFAVGGGRQSLLNPMISYFTKALRRNFPKTLLDAVDNGSYSSIVQLFNSADVMGQSCSMVMAVIEERRGLRMRSGTSQSFIDDEPLVRKISPDCHLSDSTDYHYLPNIGSRDSKPMQILVGLGALPTNARFQMALCTERFIDFVCYVQPKDSKPAKIGQILQLDWKYATETCGRLTRDMGNFRHLLKDEKAAKEALTRPEFWYYGIASRLLDIVDVLLKNGITSSPTSETRQNVVSEIKALLLDLESQTKNFLNIPRLEKKSDSDASGTENVPLRAHTFHGIMSMHTMGMLRESALLTRHTVHYLTAALDKAGKENKGRGANEVAWLVSELKKMTATATEADNTIKARISLINKNLEAPWLDHLREWTLGYNTRPEDSELALKTEITSEFSVMTDTVSAALNTDVMENWAGSVVDNWRETIKGWADCQI